MTPIFLLLATSLTIFSLGLTDFSAILGRDLQIFCQSLLPNSQFKFAYSAMVCGENLPAGILKSELQRTGLLHLFVVSGAHLIFLSLILNFIFDKIISDKKRARSFLISILLCGYALLTGFNPPVVRSLFSIGVRAVNHRQKFFWRPFDETLYAGLVTLICFPAWWGSLSFLLSWLASLGLVIGRGSLKQALVIYLLLLLPLAGLGLSDPYSIVLNWLVAPLLGLTLFPLCLLAVLIPPLVNWVDPIWWGFFQILKPLAAWLESPTVLSSAPLFISWIGVIALHLLLTRFRALRSRQKIAL